MSRRQTNLKLELKHKSSEDCSILLDKGITDTHIDKIHEDAARTLGVAKL